MYNDQDGIRRYFLKNRLPFTRFEAVESSPEKSENKKKKHIYIYKKLNQRSITKVADIFLL